MNLLLLEPEEVSGAEVRLTGRRARHVAEVIRPAEGDRLRVGVVGGATGEAEVLSLAPDGVHLAVRLGDDRPALPRVQLLLAVPRPKVLSRVLQTVGALGVARLDLTNAWRVEKSFFGSPALEPEALRRALLLGAEQGGTTWLPPVFVHSRLMAYLDDPPPQPAQRLVAHPRAAQPLEQALDRGPGECLVAVGPEGGWIERELETFADRGYVAATLGDAVLRTEQAVAVLLGQLALLARL